MTDPELAAIVAANSHMLRTHGATFTADDFSAAWVYLHECEALALICATSTALIDEIHRLHEQLANAKAEGAAEELELQADKLKAFINFQEGWYGDGHRDAITILRDRATEIRKGIK